MVLLSGLMFSLQAILGISNLAMCLLQNNTSISKTMKVTLVTLARFLVLMQAKIYHLDIPELLLIY